MRLLPFGLIMLATAGAASAQSAPTLGSPARLQPGFPSWEPGERITADRTPAQLILRKPLTRGEKGALAGAVAIGGTFALVGLAWCSTGDGPDGNCVGPVLGLALVGGTIGAVLGAFLAGAGPEDDGRASAPIMSTLRHARENHC